jgi:aerobic C4-dicarboxylate transport protein
VNSKPGSKLYLRVLIAVALGVLVGALRPEWGVALKPVGELFIRAVKMLIGPIIFCTVAGGIAGMADLKKAGRTGLLALLYFEVMTTFALLIGLGVAHLVKPGSAVHADIKQLDTTALTKITGAAPAKSFVDHLMELVPETLFSAFTEGKILQILFIAILAGIALQAAVSGSTKTSIVTFLHEASLWFFGMISVIMKAAPIGAFGAMAFTVGKFGLGTLASLLGLLATFYVTAALFVFVVLGLVCRYVGLSIVALCRYLREELVIVLGTSSSESALPGLMTKLEGLGCSPQVVRLVVPTGYSFNLDGTSIYLTLASLFVAQALGIEVSLKDEIGLLVVLLLTSKGAAAVTGGGFITLAATLGSVGTIPVAGLSLLLGIDRFMSEARALTNLVGNAVATLVVSKWENQLDLDRARQVLVSRVTEIEAS